MKRIKGCAASAPAGIAAGAGISMLVMLALAAVITELVHREVMGTGGIGGAVMGALALSSGVGAGVAAAKIRHRILLYTVLTAVVFYCCLLGINALFFGGIYEGMAAAAGAVGCGILPAVLGGIAGKGRGVRGQKTSFRKIIQKAKQGN